MSPEWLIALASALGAAAALITIFVLLKGVRDQLWISTFTVYTGRYMDAMHRLPSEARRPGGDFRLDSLSRTDREGALGGMRWYFNLCSEEFYLKSKGKIDRDTWQIWEAGIHDAIRLPCFRETWPELRAEYSFYKEFTSFIDNLAAHEKESSIVMPPVREGVGKSEDEDSADTD
jgi:hypothetical protein